MLLAVFVDGHAVTFSPRPLHCRLRDEPKDGGIDAMWTGSGRRESSAPTVQQTAGWLAPSGARLLRAKSHQKCPISLLASASCMHPLTACIRYKECVESPNSCIARPVLPSARTALYSCDSGEPFFDPSVQ